MKYLAVGSKKFLSENHTIVMKVANMETKTIISDVSLSGPSQTETYNIVRQQLITELESSNIYGVVIPTLERLITIN